MAFVVARRVSGVTKVSGRTMLRVDRLLDRLRALHVPTPQERADRYVSRMPIAVLKH